MKVCPVCNKEFADNLEFCPDDNAQLEAVENVSDDFAETETTKSANADAAAAVEAEEVQAETIREAKKADRISDDVTPNVKTATVASSSGGGLSASAKALLVVLVIALLGGGLLFWKLKNHKSTDVSMTKLTKEDMEFLLKDAPPMALKRLEDPEVKKQQVKSLREMLAMASAAQKEGLTKDEKIKTELDDIRLQLLAVNYDREINKDKGPMPPFGFIGEDRINEFWANGAREAEFKKFFDTKVELAKEDGQIEKDREPSEEDTKQAKEYFAKTRIYAAEAEQKMGEMPAEFKKKVELATKLQQAQYLSRLYAKKVLVEKTKVTPEDIEKYLAEHPELQPSPEIKKKAEDVLNRAKNGEDFAALAKEFSEDPGSKDKGGLYENVPEGQMVPEFEKAALSLEAGQVAPQLVESKFGYHIIKLEKKGGEIKAGDGSVKQTYDARHILFMTTVKDPNNPMAQPMSAKEAAEMALEEEKQKKVLDEVVANNPVEVAEDFEIPKVSEEQMQQMMQQQMMQQQQMQQQMPQEGPPGEKPKVETQKPQTKKK
jgi:parvulin-like peptidyl-prolyl isomerase